MRHCAKCGETINAGVGFCPRCGAKVDDVTQFCPRCGEEVAADERYCHKCGYPISGVEEKQAVVQQDNSGGFWKAIVTMLALVGAVFLIYIIFFKTDFSPIIGEDEHVMFVKNGTPEAWPDITYDEAFSKFFSNRHWRYFKSDTGEDVVEFTGDCIYREAQVTVRMQFILDVENGTFETGAMSFNDVPQILLVEYALIEKVFDSY